MGVVALEAAEEVLIVIELAEQGVLSDEIDRGQAFGAAHACGEGLGLEIGGEFAQAGAAFDGLADEVIAGQGSGGSGAFLHGGFDERGGRQSQSLGKSL